MGPAPKPEAQQRRKGRGLANGTTRLPSSGRRGESPTWPLPKPTKRERLLWDEIWTTPQAVAWERLGWVREVAMYIRLLGICEGKKPMAIALIERRQLADRLGLSPLAMLRLRWEITDVGDDAGPNVVDIASRMAAVAD
jgi:hypothetical protein